VQEQPTYPNINLCFLQIVAKNNAELCFGLARRPPEMKGKTLPEECLVTVYATRTIRVGEEILVNYGPDFWHTGKNKFGPNYGGK
jgi:hypothetical protein